MGFLKNIFGIFKRSQEEDFPGEAKILPAKTPPSLSIEVSWAGTLGGGYESITATAKNVLVTRSGFSERKKKEFTFDAAQLEKLYQELRTQGLDRVKVKKEIRLDFPSHHLTLKWDGYVLSKGESQTELIEGNSEVIFERCVAGLLQGLREALRDQMRPLSIRIDPVLSASDFTVSCDDRIAPYYYSATRINWANPLAKPERNELPPEKAWCIPGFSEFILRWYDESKAVEAEEKIMIPQELPETAELFLFPAGGKIGWELRKK